MKLTLDDKIIGPQNPRYTNDPAKQFSTTNNESSLNTNKRQLVTHEACNQDDFSAQFRQRKIRAKKAKLCTESIDNSFFSHQCFDMPRTDQENSRLTTTGRGSICEVKDGFRKGFDNSNNAIRTHIDGPEQGLKVMQFK